jgi:Putative prokaryotic signal transducing protein
VVYAFSQMKRVYVAGTPVDAQFVKAFLESAGIEATVRGEHLFALRGSVPMTDDTLPSVWIEDDDDLARAEVLLAQLEARSRLRPVDAEMADGADGAEEWDEGEEQIG